MNWSILETLPGLTALPAKWRTHLGNDFDRFAALWLQPGRHRATSIACPIPTSCSYRIVPEDQPPSVLCDFSVQHPLFLGLCQRDPPLCPPILLTLADITPLELNWTKLAHAISKALALNPKFATLPIPHTVQIGTWSADATPVILTIQTERHHFRHVVSELIARLHQRFILFAPTSSHFDALTQELILAAHAGLFTLDATLTLTANGNLLATKTPGDLFAKFHPQEQLPEDAALHAFAVLKSLDTDKPVRKASVFTVFRLYCMENLSAEEVAKRLHCSKATVINRLNLIRQKTGTDPANLRAYSAQFNRIEQSLSDPRARKIRPETAIDRPESDQEE